jgi:uncharacterized protein (TIGR03083 family)
VTEAENGSAPDPAVTLSPEAYLRHLRADGDRMASLADRDLDAVVPACDGWTARDALVHTGAVFSHKVACIRDGARPVDDERWSQGPADDQELPAWFRERLDELVAELESRGPDAPAFTWYDRDQTVGFWYRRMAQEAAVHRVDVESAYDLVRPVPDALAVDGVDEVLDRFLRYDAAEVGPDGPGRGTVAVRTGAHVWRVGLRPDDIDLSTRPGPADAVVSGEPSELLLWLWGRRPDTAVTREGDLDAVAGLRQRLVATTQ